jgi:hypothetical protein
MTRNASYFWGRIGQRLHRIYIGSEGQLWYWANGQRVVANSSQALDWARAHGDNARGLLTPRLRELEWGQG